MRKKEEKPRKAYKFRIYPTKEQKILFAKTFGCARFIYNQMLNDINEKKELRTPAQYKLEYEWLKEVDSLALCNAQINLFQAFQHHRDKPKHYGRPRYKSRRNRQSYSTNNQNGSVRIEEGKIKLPKVGYVKIVQHRELEEKSTIKTVTISKVCQFRRRKTKISAVL